MLLLYLNYCGRQEQPAILISRLKLRMRRMYVASEERRGVTSRYHGSKNVWISTIGSLSNNDGCSNEKGKKQQVQISKTISLLVDLSRRCTTCYMKLPRLMPRFVKQLNKVKNFLFLCQNLDTVVSNSNPENFANI